METKLKNNTFGVTENNNVVLVYNILGFELITLNYHENTALVIVYDDECNCKAICKYFCKYGSVDYEIIENTTEMDAELLDELMEGLNKAEELLDW